MEEDWVLLQTFQDPNLASLIQAMLEENGIHVVAMNKRDSSYGLFGSIELYCHFEQAYLALDLLEKSNHE
jgi:hypothetical protein